MIQTEIVEHASPDAGGATRRGMLKLLWGAAGAVAVGEGLLAGLKFLAPRTVAGEFGGVFEVGAVEDFPLGTVTPVEAGRFYLVRLAAGGFLAVYQRCTHLGCAVPFDAARGQFVCPCHGSAFELDGAVVNPPAPRPLDLFAVEIRDGLVRVDTGVTTERDRTAPEDAVQA